MNRIGEIEERLRLLRMEWQALESELLQLRSNSSCLGPGPQHDSVVAKRYTGPSAIESEHDALFLSLFRGRESVYPKLWENQSKGRKGYAPVCDNEWVRGVCGKPPHGKVKCSECPKQAFRPLDEEAITAHLHGLATIGTYAIREDDTCTFLACDFDGSGWQSDVFLYQSIAKDLGVGVLVERSRSGNGAHAWVFFSNPVPARLARSLGTLILSKCVEVNPMLELASFDRFFPSQDYLPKGGFGNLIALPFQLKPSENGNTVFIDRNLSPFTDQWQILMQVSRVSMSDIDRLIGNHVRSSSAPNSATEDAALLRDSSIIDGSSDVKALLPNGTVISVVLGSQIVIPLQGLPPKLISALKKTATFANPIFYTLQRMRMATYPNPRFIFSGELRPDSIALPRGVAGCAFEILEAAGASVHLTDDRITGQPTELAFSGTLTPEQEEAVSAMTETDGGVLVAPPGAGKTVIGCALISRRKVSTLVLVHKQPLIEQWKHQISALLNVPDKEIGVLSGAKRKLNGRVDIAMLQTVVRLDDVESVFARYGQIIVDECHHIPAVSFEAVMKRCQSKHIVGLTATPSRKDGLERLLFHQCGPVKHRIRLGDEAMSKRVIIRETGFSLPEVVGSKPPYHVVAELLATDQRRNALIALDIRTMADAKRFTLVIADRKQQLDQITRVLQAQGENQTLNIFRFDGALSPKKRRDVLEAMGKARNSGAICVLFSTASLIGEGVDIPELSALVLASPISFEGRLVQYAGRLHREAEGKTEVTILDYVDSNWAVSISMYRNRLRAYSKMGYRISKPDSTSAVSAVAQGSLFN